MHRLSYLWGDPGTSLLCEPTMPLVAYFCNKSQIVVQLCTHDFGLFMQFHPSLSFHLPIIYASLVNSNYLVEKNF